MCRTHKEAETMLSKYDVSRERDLAYAIANLIEAECHLHQTCAEAEGKKKLRYAEIIQAIRKIRGKYFEKILKNKDYGCWCCFKHLLSAFIQLSEVGTKLIDENNLEEGAEFLTDSQVVLKMFFLINSMGEKNDNRQDRLENIQNHDGREGHNNNKSCESNISTKK